MNEEIEAAERAMTAASKGLSAGKEGEYAAAYQVLVRLGVRPQLRPKYR